MQIGMLTAPFGKESLLEVMDFAANAGFDALEVAGRHMDVMHLTQAEADSINKDLEERDLSISSLAFYLNPLDPDSEKQESNLALLHKAIDAAQMLGVPTVCTLAGFPVPGKDKVQTIEEDCPKVFIPLCEYAASKGINIALENWFATNIQNLDHWERLFRVVPNANFGLNFDPSHLLWQGIDYIRAVHHFADRIFHTHAKDTEILDWKLAWYGNQERGWWRYVIPGFGRVKWGELIAALRLNGYNGVLSIEHEDRALSREEGFIKGRAFLAQFA